MELFWTNDDGDVVCGYYDPWALRTLVYLTLYRLTISVMAMVLAITIGTVLSH